MARLKKALFAELRDGTSQWLSDAQCGGVPRLHAHVPEIPLHGYP